MTYLDIHRATIELAVSGALLACLKAEPASPLAFIASYVLKQAEGPPQNVVVMGAANDKYVITHIVHRQRPAWRTPPTLHSAALPTLLVLAATY